MTQLSRIGILRSPARIPCARVAGITAVVIAFLIAFAISGSPAVAATHSAVGDSYTKSASPAEKNGSQKEVRAQKWADITTFLKFNIGEYKSSSAVKSAQLRIPVKGVSMNGTVTVHRVLANWNEKSINYNNQPRLGGAVASFSARKADQGKVLVVDVTSALRQMAGTSSGAYGLALKTANGNVQMFSRESGSPIQLVVNAGSSGGSSGGSGGGSSSSSGGSSGNAAPSISGKPATSVTANSQYSFRPTASDPDGDTLKFSISGKPTWAAFSTSTGQLSGKPSGGHVGRYDGIGISVSDGKVSKSLAPFYITVDAASNGRVTLSWLPPTANTDGSTLTNLDGYRIDWRRTDTGATGSVTINNASVTNYVVDNLAAGRYRFTVAATNTRDMTSEPSNAVTTTVN